MKVRITARNFPSYANPLAVGTIVDVGEALPAAWEGKCEVVGDTKVKAPINPAEVKPDPFDHDGDGTPGGSKPKLAPPANKD